MGGTHRNAEVKEGEAKFFLPTVMRHGFGSFAVALACSFMASALMDI